jgi:glycogen debranching enzyme
MRIAANAFVTPLGLRTLAPADPRFIGAYRGDQHSRDAAYHQGTAWPWLVGVLADGSRATGICAEEVTALLTSLRAQLTTAGVGTLGEIADGAPPYHPCGCVAQAWSVAETLRVLWERANP